MAKDTITNPNAMYRYKGTYHRLLNNADSGATATVNHDGILVVNFQSTNNGYTASIYFNDTPVGYTNKTDTLQLVLPVMNGVVISAQNAATRVYADLYY